MMGLQKRLQRCFKLIQQGFDFNEEIKQVKLSQLNVDSNPNARLRQSTNKQSFIREK